MNPLRRWKAYRAKLQEDRCAMGRHHWIVYNQERVRCWEPGCGKWWGR